MTRIIEFTIPGVPEQKHSPMLGSINGHAIAFKDERNTAYESIIRSALHDSGYVHTEPHAGPVALRCLFYFPVGAWSKKKIDAVQLQYKIGPPDIDRLINNIQDALSHGVVYKDDSQISMVFAYKKYDPRPRTEVKVTLFDPVYPDLICKAMASRGGKRKAK